jgi:hypothetical protein
MKKKAAGYAGVLAMPIQLEADIGQYFERLKALFAEFEIPPGPEMWAQLALELAFRHVPGFQMKSNADPAAGRRVAFAQLLDDAELIYAIDGYVAQDDQSILSAAEKVAEDRKKAKKLKQKEKPSALEAKYRRLKKEFRLPVEQQTRYSNIRGLLLQFLVHSRSRPT